MTPEGRLQLVSNGALLAGSICPLREAVAGLARRGLTTLEDAWAMASERPSRLLGLATAPGLVTRGPRGAFDRLRLDGDDIWGPPHPYKAGRVVHEPRRAGYRDVTRSYDGRLRYQ